MITQVLLVVPDLSLACKFMLLIRRSVSQFAGGYINDFSGHGGVVIEAAGIDVFHVSISVESRGEVLHAPVAHVPVP